MVDVYYHINNLVPIFSGSETRLLLKFSSFWLQVPMERILYLVFNPILYYYDVMSILIDSI